MKTPSLMIVAGPSGSGKTTWISQYLEAQDRPLFYLAPGVGEVAIDRTHISERFPWVQIVSEDQLSLRLANLPEEAVVYLELGSHLELLSTLPGSWHRVAILPPTLRDSEWQDWADEIVPGNAISLVDSTTPPTVWRSHLTGQVFDPPSLDQILTELTGGAYGSVQRVKGIFELPDGRAFHIDFVEGLPGIAYTELNRPRWLQGRPSRFSGIEVVGWDLATETIAQTLRAGCLSDSTLAHYQQQYSAIPQNQEGIPA